MTAFPTPHRTGVKQMKSRPDSPISTAFRTSNSREMAARKALADARARRRTVDAARLKLQREQEERIRLVEETVQAEQALCLEKEGRLHEQEQHEAEWRQQHAAVDEP